MKKIPTAIEFILKDGEPLSIHEMLIKFAKLHVSEALTQVQLKARLRVGNKRSATDFLHSYECGDDEVRIDLKSIRKAYPLTKIK